MSSSSPSSRFSSTFKAPPFRKLSVLMPVYNEARTLRTIVRRVLEAPVEITIELVIVDDGSTDGSREIIRELSDADPRIRPIFHEKNQGKAGAIRTAIREMTGDLALVQDADLEYNPQDYPALLRPMMQGIADAVFGSRFLSGEHRRVTHYWHTLANKLLTLMCNALNNLTLTDMETGYKLIRADVLRAIPLTASGFAFEPELTTRLAQWNLRLFEVPISYEGRTYAEGKKIGLRDALQAIGAMIRYRFFSRRFTTHDGYLRLESARGARRARRWLMSRITPFLGRRVIEGGCGIGNLSEFLLDRERLICLDSDPFYVEMIGRRFGHLENVHVRELDLSHIDDCPLVREAEPDTVVCVNVLEHIEDDIRVLRGFHDVLQPGGHAVILVAAHPGLYTGMDRTLGRCRRYTRPELEGKIRAAGFDLVECEGFNRLGTLSWYVAGKWLKRKTLTPGQMRMCERLVPVAKLIEKVPVWPHLSLIAVGRKPDRRAGAPAIRRKAG